MRSFHKVYVHNLYAVNYEKNKNNLIISPVLFNVFINIIQEGASDECLPPGE